MIEIDAISRRFGRVQALDRVSFEVAPGEVVGFLGPNGAGKTTALRIVAGFLAPDEGHARVRGVDVTADPLGAQAELGYLPEDSPLPRDLRVMEYLAYRARLKSVPRGQRVARVAEGVERLRLGEVRRRACGALSRGFRQRVGLADALLARPSALVLDEPASGLDPNEQRELWGTLRELGRERAVLLSSHALADVEAVATRVVILVAGRVVANDTPAALAGAGTLADAFARLAGPEQP